MYVETTFMFRGVEILVTGTLEVDRGQGYPPIKTFEDIQILRPSGHRPVSVRFYDAVFDTALEALHKESTSSFSVL